MQLKRNKKGGGVASNLSCAGMLICISHDHRHGAGKQQIIKHNHDCNSAVTTG